MAKVGIYVYDGERVVLLRKVDEAHYDEEVAKAEEEGFEVSDNEDEWVSGLADNR